MTNSNANNKSSDIVITDSVISDTAISEIALRDLSPAEMPDFHQLRLDATHQLPRAFGPSHAQLKKMTVEQNRQSFHQSWGADDNFIAGAWRGETLIGTVGLLRVAEGNANHTAIIWNVFVQPVFQGQGVARNLMQYVIARARGIGGLEVLKLESSATQHRAVDFYQSQGFRLFGREPRGLKVAGDYIDVLHMAMRL